MLYEVITILWTTSLQSQVLASEAGQFGTSGGVAHYDNDGFLDLFVGAPYATDKKQVGIVYRNNFV